MALLIEKLAQYWSYPFVRYALVVGVLVALCSSLLGVTLVLKRFSFIGDGLSHVAFGAMSVASVLNLTNDMPLVMGITVLCAILLLGTGRNARINGDAAMAMFSVGALAVGYLIMNVFSTSDRRCLYHSFRFHLHPHSHQNQGLDVRSTFSSGGALVHLFLP